MVRQERSDAPPPPFEDVDHAALRDLFESQRVRRWAVARTTARERAAKLIRLKREIVARSSELFDALEGDLGKHASETELTELQPVLAEINHSVKHLDRWMRPRRVATPITLFGTRSEVRAEPKGVVLVLAPWNYPFLLMISPLVAAVGAGNCAILKPSEKTPRTSAFMKRLVEAVFDPNEAAVVEGEADTAKALLELPFDHVFFTGSTRVGRLVMEAAAQHLATVTLELGGKSPVLVDETVDVDRAARRIVWGKFINAGQTCVAPDYVLVPASLRDAFVERATAAVRAAYGETEDARRASGDYCRLVDRSGVERLHGLVRDAVAHGARVAIGGDGDPDERYFSPTIVTDVDPDAQLMHEEIFGPVLPVVAYGTLEEALAFVRANGKPLALYVFSDRQAVVERIIEETTAGGTVVNNVVVHLANPNLPFGGVGESGMGNYHGEFGFRTFSHERAVLRQGIADVFRFLYPPYTAKVRTMVNRVTYWHRR